MSELPRVAIVLVTYARTEYAVRTVRSMRKHLSYSQELGWYVADDGSPGSHFDEVVKAVGSAPIIGLHSEDFVPDKKWPGKSWNKAWEFAHEWAPVVLWLEDDWELQRELNIDPYVELLMSNENIGMVRLGHLAINLNMTSVGHDGIHYLQMWRNMPYGFSGNPSLRHQRFAQAYGPYKEDIGPGDTEVEYDTRFRNTSGPEILWPVNLPGCGWSCFAHIGEKQSY